MIIKVVSSHEPGDIHVKDRIFAGPDRGHLQLAGTLTWNINTLYSVTKSERFEGLVTEWQLFGAALGLGALRMAGDVEVILEGDKEVTASIEETARRMAHGGKPRDK